MIIPEFLKKGDTIGITATARKVKHEELQPAIDLIESWGLKVKLSRNLFTECDQFSGTDEQRAGDLQSLIDDHDVKAIICARGGYGTLRIIDAIDFSSIIKNPKWIVGYSDITILHSHLAQNFSCASIHGPMAFNLTKNLETAETVRKALFGEQIKYQIESHSLNRNGIAEGELVGGNLSLIYALQGSISNINTEGTILFLEDLDEYLYHIDRMMLSLKRAGKLKTLAGLVIGGMSDMRDNTIPFGKTAEEIITDAVSGYNYPVCFNFPAGHIENNNAIYIGKKIRLEVSSTPSLNYL